LRTINTVSRALYVCNLVAAAFVPKPDTRAALILCNKDNNKLNDAADNLEWRVK